MHQVTQEVESLGWLSCVQTCVMASLRRGLFDHVMTTSPGMGSSSGLVGFQSLPAKTLDFNLFAASLVLSPLLAYFPVSQALRSRRRLLCGLEDPSAPSCELTAPLPCLSLLQMMGLSLLSLSCSSTNLPALFRLEHPKQVT